MHALRFTSMDARSSFRSALARFALYLYQMLPYKYASLHRRTRFFDSKLLPTPKAAFQQPPAASSSLQQATLRHCSLVTSAGGAD